MRNISALLFLLAPLALMLVAVQATLVERLNLAGGHPDLILVTIVLLTMAGGRQAALLPALVLAPLFDALAGLPLGASIIPLLSVVYLAGLGERALFGAHLGWPIFITLAATIVAGLITLVELAIFGWEIAWTDTIIRVLLPSAALNALLVLVLYLPIEYLRESRAATVD